MKNADLVFPALINKDHRRCEREELMQLSDII